jgi:hypothetical protein
MKIGGKNISILTILIYIFLFSTGIIFIHQLLTGYEKGSWQITEWLINYQGGFVRRGLPGEILFRLHNLTGIDTYRVIVITCLIAYLIFIWFFVNAFNKKGLPLMILPFVFFLGGPIINDFWVRKDVIIMLIFISSVYLSVTKSKWRFVLINVLLIIGVLSHEMIGFFALPVLLIIFFNEARSKEQSRWLGPIIKSCFTLAPAIITFLMCLYFKGSLLTATSIWDSWKDIKFPHQLVTVSNVPPSINTYALPGAINGLTWSLKQGLSVGIDTLKNFHYGIYAPLAWLIILTMIYLILTNLDKINGGLIQKSGFNDITRSNITNTLIFQFIFIVPLFIIGWDYGRWVFFWVSSSFAILVLIPGERLASLFPSFILRFGTIVNKIFDSVTYKYPTLIYLVIFILGVPSRSWSIYTYLTTTPVVIIIRPLLIIRRPLMNLLF